jgi:hypothetical protein
MDVNVIGIKLWIGYIWLVARTSCGILFIYVFSDLINNIKKVYKEAVVAYLRHYPGICLDGRRYQPRTFVWIVGIVAKIRTKNFPITLLLSAWSDSRRNARQTSASRSAKTRHESLSRTAGQTYL